MSIKPIDVIRWPLISVGVALLFVGFLSLASSMSVTLGLACVILGVLRGKA